MRFKYTLEKESRDKLVLKEYTETDGEIYSLQNEIAYDEHILSSAISKGENDLLSILRTDNLYPPRIYAAVLSDMVFEFLSSDNKTSMELIVDDLDYLDKKWKRPRRRRTEPIEEEPLDADDAFEACADNTCTLKNVDENNKPDLMEEMFPFDEVA
jgi:hypothetical protein